MNFDVSVGISDGHGGELIKQRISDTEIIFTSVDNSEVVSFYMILALAFILSIIVTLNLERSGIYPLDMQLLKKKRRKSFSQKEFDVLHERFRSVASLPSSFGHDSVGRKINPQVIIFQTPGFSCDISDVLSTIDPDGKYYVIIEYIDSLLEMGGGILTNGGYHGMISKRNRSELNDRERT